MIIFNLNNWGGGGEMLWLVDLTDPDVEGVVQLLEQLLGVALRGPRLRSEVDVDGRPSINVIIF
jgi:hypothetical protein